MVQVAYEGTILVVEDELPLQKAITAKLTHTGFKTIGVRSVKDALEVMEQRKDIDVIWLDHYLIGKKDGLDLVQQLKDDTSPYRETPIFVVSNTASDDKVRQYLKLGITEYYVKATNKLDQIISDMKQTLQLRAAS